MCKPGGTPIYQETYMSTVCSGWGLCGSFCVQRGGRRHTTQPPCFFKAIHARSQKEASCHPCLQEGKVVGIILLANGGAAPLHPLFETIHLTVEESCHRHACSKGRLCESFCFSNGGRLAPPKPPAVLKSFMLPVKYRVIICHHPGCSRGKFC